jgi:beta-N-acetylhexosaminidase
MRIMLFFLCWASLYGRWAEDTLNILSLEEKVGQLFVAPACPKYDSDSLEKLFSDCHIGSVIVKQGAPKEQIIFLNRLQENSKWPLLCAGDAEWGLGMRMEETLSFPKNEVMGKVKNSFLIYLAGKEIGVQCRMVGIHLNLAPVVDVNNNPKNIVIGPRSFGDRPDHVSVCSFMMVQGMKEGKVLSCLKHFPGHGDTEIDSHKGLPMIPHDRAHLERVEFVPFKDNLAADAVMTGHLLIPALDPEYPASLSKVIVTDLLQKEWGFKGLVITDALNMKALTENYSVEEIAIKALLAGHDLLLYGAHLYDDVEVLLTEVIPRAYEAILSGAKEGRVPIDLLDAHVLKVLKVKEGLNLHEERIVPLPDDLMDRLHTKDALDLIERIKKGA